ncbi:MAG: hypothetical protein AB4352_26645 [Hormoscilla sp.]
MLFDPVWRCIQDTLGEQVKVESALEPWGLGLIDNRLSDPRGDRNADLTYDL